MAMLGAKMQAPMKGGGFTPLGFMPPQFAPQFQQREEDLPTRIRSAVADLVSQGVPADQIASHLQERGVPQEVFMPAIQATRAPGIGGGVSAGSPPLLPPVGPPGSTGPTPVPPRSRVGGPPPSAPRLDEGKPEGRRGFLGNINWGRAAIGFFGGGPQLQAADQRRMQRQRLEMEQAQAQEAQDRRESMFNNLVKPADSGGFGVSAGEAERIMSNPEAFGTNFNTRYGAWNGSPGEGRYIPNGGAPPTITQAPTTAELHARAMGLQPGTPAYNLHIQDETLNSQGPTGTETSRRGQDISERNSIRSTGATIRGQDISHRDRVTDPRRVPPGTNRPPSPAAIAAAIMAKQARGEQLTPAEQEVLRTYQAGRGGRAGGRGSRPRPTGRTATGPRGRIMQMSDGSWVPFQGAGVVQ